MSYKSLQKRSSKTEISEKTGTFKKKKRFGKSLQNHAPSMFLNIINTKLSYIGKHICYVNTQKTRCSQYNHMSGECQKATLSERWKQLSNEIIVQRDLYSAFLLQHAQDQETIDTKACIAAFDGSKILHNKVIQDLKQKNKKELVILLAWESNISKWCRLHRQYTISVSLIYIEIAPYKTCYILRPLSL